MIRRNIILWLTLIVLSGVGFRLILATGSYNYDVAKFYEDVELFKQGKNIYLFQIDYRYSPLFWYYLGFLSMIGSLTKVFPFYFLIRASLMVVDTVTLFVLLGLSRKRSISLVTTAAIFFLNPISIIVSGHYGQFDNIAIFFLLLGILIYQHRESFSYYLRIFSPWVLLTVGLLFKHTVFFAVLSYWVNVFKSVRKGTILFVFSILVFLLTFIPYWEAKDQIINNVFHYGGAQGVYGISYLIEAACPNCSFLGMSFLNIYRYIFYTG